MATYLHVGGCIAAGFDTSGEYLLAISHNGRGVFSTKSWERVARDYNVVFPKDGICVGIGPLDGHEIKVTEIDYSTGILTLTNLGGDIQLRYSEGVIEVNQVGRV